MKKVLLGVALAILFTNNASAQFKEYGNNPANWKTYTKVTGSITKAPSGVRLLGKGMKTGYFLTFPTLKDNPKTVQWDMKYSENYAIYFLLNTSKGIQYLRYSSLSYDKGIHGKFISFGLGRTSKDGKWHSFKRNLQKDLNKFKPNSKILSIKTFLIRGSGMLRNIEVINSSSPIKEFDMKKFNKLLQDKIDKENEYFEEMYGKGLVAVLGNTSDEHIKYIYHPNMQDNDWVNFYTLSSDQTKLKVIIGIDSILQNIRVDNIKFNLEHTKMTFTAHYGDTTHKNHEALLY